MEVRIGITDANSPLTITMPEGTDRDGIKLSIERAMAGKPQVLWITDDKGREYAVAGSKITHVEIGPSGSHHIGFS